METVGSCCMQEHLHVGASSDATPAACLPIRPELCRSGCAPGCTPAASWRTRWRCPGLRGPSNWESLKKKMPVIQKECLYFLFINFLEPHQKNHEIILTSSAAIKTFCSNWSIQDLNPIFKDGLKNFPLLKLIPRWKKRSIRNFCHLPYP